MDLQDFFREHPKAALAFSGGVDSAYLLYEAVKAGVEVRPYFVKTAFQPEFELEDALKLGRQLGVEITVIPCDILPSAGHNPPDRCYHCKRALFGTLLRQAEKDGLTLVMDGTNASDDAADRPGMKALKELEVRSPLRECGFTKDMIREKSRQAGLFTWNKPAYACLATRFPAGTPITEEALRKVELAEETLFSLGFTDFRVRMFEGAARIQVKEAQMPGLLDRREKILTALKPLFRGVFLDLEGR
ncbi:MAG: ATP-dependent sacrificial sulfur transferase LarE [Oscillospiraceae bacterium]|nr:ATP-dependent sacrificial sulfur transferase LarE [Oscillospiraceae bacterium]